MRISFEGQFYPIFDTHGIKMHKIFNKLYMFLRVGSILLVAFGGIGCDQPLFRNDLEAIRADGELVVITRNSAECYYQGPFGPRGFEYDLVKAFADHLGVQARAIIVDDEAEMVEILLEGKAHIIAAGFPFGRQSARLVTLGPRLYRSFAASRGSTRWSRDKKYQGVITSPPSLDDTQQRSSGNP